MPDLHDSQSCPSDPEIQRLIFPATSEDAGCLQVVRQHVQQCPTCQTALQRLTAAHANDTHVVSRVRDAIDQPPEEDSLRDDSSFDITPPVAPLNRPHASSTTPSLEFLSPPQAPDEIGRLGGYRILRLLGTGGMGIVLKAEDISLQRVVAIKVMKPLLAVYDTARLRFLREARAAASINHENVVQIYQVGEDRDIPFLSMEILDGESLETRLRRDCKLSLEEALSIGRGVAAGLVAAHRRGVIHRDIKPANIILLSVDPDIILRRSIGQITEFKLEDQNSTTSNEPSSAPTRPSALTKVKIVDFGLARAVDDDTELTQSGVIAGTPQYMSPEQAEGNDVDVRSDIFSFGCVLYRMITGEVPFSGRSSSAILMAVVGRPHRPMRQIDSAIPEPVDQMINRMLAKSRDDRIATSSEVLGLMLQLEEALHGNNIPLDAKMTADSRSENPSVELVTPESSPTPSRKGNRLRQLIIALLLLICVGLSASWSPFKSQHTLPSVSSPPLSTQPADVKLESTHIAENTSPPVHPEPLPLSEWLKGRTVLTVAQKAGAQFQSIQAALDAIKPGQAVEILDFGPYEEPLRLIDPPEDIGIFSRVGTLLQAPRVPHPSTNVGLAYLFEDVAGFRLSGLAFADQPRHQRLSGVTIACTGQGEMVIENCIVHTLGPLDGMAKERFEILFLRLNEKNSRATIRECQFTGRSHLMGNGGSALFTRNLFMEYPSHALVFTGISSAVQVDVTRNLFHRSSGIHWDAASAKMQRLSVCNNSFLGTWSTIAIGGDLLNTSLDYARNLTQGHIELWTQKGIEAVDRWNRAENLYFVGGGVPEEKFLPPTSRDRVSSLSDFALRMSPDSRNFLRVLRFPDGFEKTDGFIGALPFGPAPEQPDWFSRLLDRSKAAQSHRSQFSVAAPSQPSADRWLPGPAEDIIPGLIGQPASLPGIRRWQIETRWPRAGAGRLRISSEGRMAVAACDGSVRIMSVQPLALHQIFRVPTSVTSLDWQPGGGHQLVTGDEEGNLDLWSRAGQRTKTWSSEQSWLDSISWNRTGTLFATLGRSGVIHIWTANGDLKTRINEIGAKHAIEVVSWGPDEGQLTFVDNEGVIQTVRDDGSERTAWNGRHLLDGMLSWDPAGQTLVTWGRPSRELQFWNRSGDLIASVKTDPGWPRMRWSPDGHALATWNGLGPIMFWTPTGEPAKIAPVTEFAGSVGAFDWTVNGGGFVVAAVHEVRNTRLFDGSGQEIPTPIRANSIGGWAGLNVDAATGRILAALFTGDVACWSDSGRRQIFEKWSPFGTAMFATAFRRPGEGVAVGGYYLGEQGSHLELRNADGSLQHAIRTTDVRTLAVDKTTGRIASAGPTGKIHLWFPDGKPERILRGHEGNVNGLAWSHDGQTLASFGADDHVRLWPRGESEGPVMSAPSLNTLHNNCLEWNRAGLLACAGRKVQVWNSGGELVYEPSPLGATHSIAWHPDGEILAVSEFSGSNKRLRQFQLKLFEREKLITPPRFLRAASHVAWGPSGTDLHLAESSSNVSGPLMCINPLTGETKWIATITVEGASFTFTGAGQLFEHLPDLADFDRKFVYLVEQLDGQQEVVEPAEFRKRFPNAVLDLSEPTINR